MPKTKKKDTVIVEDTMESIPVDDIHADEPSYTVDEFAACSRDVFGTGPDIVRAAFFCAGIQNATKARAMEIVQEFRKA